MAFKKPPTGRRGYDEEDVDAFLDEVEQELARLLEENAALHDRVQRGAGPGPSDRMLDAERADLAARLDRMQAARARAEEDARALQAQLEQARRAAVAPPAEADDRLAPVLMMARRTADDHLRDAERTAETLLAESRAKAAKLASEAQLEATTMESDARRRHTDAIHNIEVERAALLEEIDRLTRLLESYRAALEGHITQQMRNLDGAPDQP